MLVFWFPSPKVDDACVFTARLPYLTSSFSQHVSALAAYYEPFQRCDASTEGLPNPAHLRLFSLPDRLIRQVCLTSRCGFQQTSYHSFSCVVLPSCLTTQRRWMTSTKLTSVCCHPWHVACAPALAHPSVMSSQKLQSCAQC